jgi:ankyrin repeat protein
MEEILCGGRIDLLKKRIENGWRPKDFSSSRGSYSALTITDSAGCHPGNAWSLATPILLQYGADPHIPAPSGKLPLSLAVEDRAYQAIEQFVTHGVDLNARNADGSTAIMWAETIAMVKFLVALGADATIVDGQGNPSWTRAARTGRLFGVVETLKSAADQEAKNSGR